MGNFIGWLTVVAFGLLTVLAQQHDCDMEQGNEINMEDDSCESYWSCRDYQGTLSRCQDDTQFDYAWRECRPNREVWCQWQVQTVQWRGGIKGTPFDLTSRQGFNIKKPWLRERVNGQYRPILTYNGHRPAKSYTHTHDGSTHMHLLDAQGQYIDTTDHFHQSRNSPSIVREKREVGLSKKEADNVPSTFNKGVKWGVHKKIGESDQAFNQRSKDLGIYYDVMALQGEEGADGGENSYQRHGGVGNEEDEGKFPEVDAGVANNPKDAEDYEYDQYDEDDIVCRGGFGREPDLQDPECKLFWECTKESINYMECDENYLYDFEKKDCMLHTEVNCKGQLAKAKQMKPEYPTVSGKKGKDMTVVHHFYHGETKPLPGKLPDDIFKVVDDEPDSVGDRSILPKKRDFTLLSETDHPKLLSEYDQPKFLNEDLIIKRMRRSSLPLFIHRKTSVH